MEKKKILLLVDWLPEKGSLLRDCISRGGFQCDLMGTDFSAAQWTPIGKVISHWPRCLGVALKAFMRRREYDYIVAWPQVIGMFLGMIKGLTRSESPRVFLLNATIVERKNCMMESLRRCFIRLTYRKVDHVSFLSRASMMMARDRFGLSDEQCVHLPQPLTYEKLPEFSGFRPDSYLYSVGLSYRDYPTLMVAAAKVSKPFVVAATDAFLKGVTVPDNVTIYRNTFGEAAEKLMRDAAAVIFPLAKTNSPAGETTLVAAMSHGKPVIVTKTITTEEYINHGESGLLVPWKDPEAIADAVRQLFSDGAKAEAMGREAREAVLRRHTMEVYAGRMLAVIRRDLDAMT